METLVINIEPMYIGNRIDRFCVDTLTDISRSSVQKMIEKTEIVVNDKQVKPNYKLRKDDIVTIKLTPPKEMEIIPVKMDLEILYEDEDVIVVNKPQGMVVHPANGHYDDTLVNGLMHHTKNTLSGINGELRPGIVHRIDKDTSGVIVVAKNDVAHNHLSEQLANHTMTRVYYAVVVNNVKTDEGTIDAPIGRDKKDRKKMTLDRNGRRAVTHYKVLQRLKNATLIQCQLETGRTHQIRVHLTSKGHYLLGDPVYGSEKQKHKLEGQALHAKILGFIHPRTNEYMEFSAPLPEYFNKLVLKLGGEAID